MNPVEYQNMHAAEERMWWYRAAHRNLLVALSGSLRPGVAILDAGCGTGGLLSKLRTNAPGAALFGIDLDHGAATLARDKSGAELTIGSINELPYAENAFDIIVSADVLCHRSVDEPAALAALRRCLRPGGTLVLNLPAFEWLKSGHDDAVHTVRRYMRSDVNRLLAATGFSPVRTYYWNSLLFPLMVLRRKLLARSHGAQSDVMDYPLPVELAFRVITRMEHELQRVGIRLPFGGSVIAVATKP
jgi:SAM-dependent methyltransferase